jgi:hypothetical protein
VCNTVQNFKQCSCDSNKAALACANQHLKCWPSLCRVLPVEGQCTPQGGQCQGSSGPDAQQAAGTPGRGTRTTASSSSVRCRAACAYDNRAGGRRPPAVCGLCDEMTITTAPSQRVLQTTQWSCMCTYHLRAAYTHITHVPHIPSQHIPAPQCTGNAAPIRLPKRYAVQRIQNQSCPPSQ